MSNKCKWKNGALEGCEELISAFRKEGITDYIYHFKFCPWCGASLEKPILPEEKHVRALELILKFKGHGSSFLWATMQDVAGYALGKITKEDLAKGSDSPTIYDLDYIDGRKEDL